MIVHCDDALTDPRWPRFAERVRGAGVRAVAAAPIEMGEDRVGVLNAYYSEPGVTHDSVETVELLASGVGAVLHEMSLKAELEALAEQLSTALTSRAVIEQAKGIVVGVARCDPDEAFARLVKASRDSNIKLRVLAARIVEEAAAGRVPRL